MQGLVRGFRGGNASGQAAAGAAASASRHAQRGGMIRAEHSAGVGCQTRGHCLDIGTHASHAAPGASNILNVRPEFESDALHA